jgi:hypothetical protein
VYDVGFIECKSQREAMIIRKIHTKDFLANHIFGEKTKKIHPNSRFPLTNR